MILTAVSNASEPTEDGMLWSLKPIAPIDVPHVNGTHANPIDAFLARTHRDKELVPVPPADKLTLLRRVSLDLTGLPPTIAEQDTFIGDDSSSAYTVAVDRLLDSQQHGVRYARHWLDIMRYADVDGTDGNMPAGTKIYLWRDWVISALNNDIPYDDFVRVQITGYRTSERTRMSAVGIRSQKLPRPDDMFALGFLSRNATRLSDKNQALAMNAVETISTAFMGMTVGCAKCHDHFYDPIEQREFYAMKALFDPLKLHPIQLATAEEIFAHGQKLTIYERERTRIEQSIKTLTQIYHDRLYNERVEMLPPEIQPVIRKPQTSRTFDEQKVADEYYPILRIDSGKLRAIMPDQIVKQYDDLRKKLDGLNSPNALPVFWTVAEDDLRRQQPQYILNSGDADRPEKDSPVEPGFPFADIDAIDFREGLREGFVDWLADDENPLFARVAVNRIWQWHFGKGLHRAPSDFGELGEIPFHPELLDWLATEFIEHDYSMKWLHRLIVTSDAYKRSSADTNTENSNGKYVANRHSHGDIKSHAPLCRQTDKPIAGLIRDLKLRATVLNTVNRQVSILPRASWGQPQTPRFLRHGECSMSIEGVHSSLPGETE